MIALVVTLRGLGTESDPEPTLSRCRHLRRHLIWNGSLSVVVSIVERLVPDELWELFQRVV
uniref:hypothetical protein n=1 Tax=Streptomyces bicolor TaxID=66874 RepID=UPI001AE0991C